MDDFKRIYDTYYAAVRSFYARRGFSPEDCFDLTQETFLGIHKGMKSYRHQERLGPWVFTIARNTYRKRLRSMGTVKRSGDEVSIEDPSSAAGIADAGPLGKEPPLSQESRLIQLQRKAQLHRAIDQLPEAQRQCLTLYLEGISYKQIAAVTRLAVDTVKSHLRRARHNLRAMFEEVDAISQGQAQSARGESHAR